MIFIIIIILYNCRRILYFVTDVDKLVVTDVPEYITAVPVVTYVAYILCAVMKSACISTFGVRTFMGSNIEVYTIVRNNTPSHNADT